MSVEFQEDQNVQALYERMQQNKETPSRVTSLFVKMGLAKDAESANKAMLIVAVLAIIVTLFVIFRYIL
jgi:hypothetical protein